MPEPTKCLGEHSIVISPEDQGRRRTWPNPRRTEHAEWLVWHNRDALTDDDIKALARAAGAYRMVFGATGRDFAPTHSAIRAALAAPAPAEDECGAGHDPERICCAHARDVERLRVDRELHQDRADRLAVELMRLRDQIGEVIAADRRFENAPAPAREQADPADEDGEHR